MRSPCSLCVCVFVYPSINFWMPEPIFMKLGMYIMAPGPNSTVYSIIFSHQSVCLYVYSLSLLGNGLVKIPLSFLGNSSLKILLRQRIHTQQYKHFWTRSFLCGPCRIKESRWLVLPRTSSVKIKKVAGLIHDEVFGFFNWPNPSNRTMALGPTQSLTEMSTRNFPGGKGRPARGADNLTATCEPIV
jgi:hypothetical protein